MGTIASQITSITIVYSIVYSGTIEENIKAPRHWPLCGEFTGPRWIPLTKGQLRGKCFHLMTSSCVSLNWQMNMTQQVSRIWTQSSHMDSESNDVDGLVQERHNSSALAMELHLSGTNPLIYDIDFHYIMTVCLFHTKPSPKPTQP